MPGRCEVVGAVASGTIGVEERRARLGLRHHLAGEARARDVVDVAGDLVGLHATDPKTVFLSARARMRDAEIEDIEDPLYEERSLVRMLGMRRTLFVEPLELAAVVHAACGLTVAARERRKLLRRLEVTGLAKDPERWLRRLENDTLEALAARGEATATELSEDVPRLRTKVLLAEGKSYEALQSISFWVLLGLAAQGRIVRGRPRGSWISSQYRWTLMQTWIPGGLTAWTPENAQAELVRRWLASFGPGTLADIRWWTGLSAAEVKRALASIEPVEVALDDEEVGLVLPGDLEPVVRPKPWIAFLPGLDSTVMGWTRRHWFLDEHGPALFDTNGNAGPTVWWNGRVVGGWSQRREGDVVFKVLEDVGREALTLIEAEAERVRRWLGDVTVTPRFWTPLARELSA
jgi:hypothetical protein